MPTIQYKFILQFIRDFNPVHLSNYKYPQLVIYYNEDHKLKQIICLREDKNLNCKTTIFKKHESSREREGLKKQEIK